MKKLMLKRLALFLTVFTVLFSIGAFDIYSLSDIKICVNGQYLQLDVPPVIENGRPLCLFVGCLSLSMQMLNGFRNRKK